MKRIGSFVLALIFTMGGASAFAEGTKIGVVDLQKIMQTSAEMKGIQEKLEKEFKPRRDKLVAMEDGLKKDMEQFKRDSAVLSQTQRKDLEKKIVTTQQQFEREGQQYQQELSTAHHGNQFVHPPLLTREVGTDIGRPNQAKQIHNQITTLFLTINSDQRACKQGQ